MPNPENFTPIQRFRMDKETWRQFGELVGDRQRSSELKAFIEWRTGKPGARLPAPHGDRRRHGLIVWIDEQDGDTSVHVHDLPGGPTDCDDELLAGVGDAVQKYLAARAKIVEADRERAKEES